MPPLAEDEYGLRCQLAELRRRLPDHLVAVAVAELVEELAERLRRRTAERDHLREASDE